MVVDVPVTLVFVANRDEPAALYIFTVYEDAPVLAFQETSIDFSVKVVADAATDVGVLSVVGGACTDTAASELVVVLLPSAPYAFLPQHFTVVSLRTAHEW
jgi:hypothetical protein